MVSNMDNAVKLKRAKKNQSLDVKALLCNLGIIAIYIVLGITLFEVSRCFNHTVPESGDYELGELIWDSFFSVVSGALAVIEIIAALVLVKTRKDCSKTKIIVFSIITYAVAIFDNVAIKYPLPQSVIVLTHFFLFVALVAYILLKKPKVLIEQVSQSKGDNVALKRAISGTENKKIIAIQMYSITTEHHMVNGVEKTRYIVKSGESFIRDGHDLNSVSAITYELDRTVVDEFEAILQSYRKFLKYGNDETKDKLIESLDKKISELEKRLKTIEEQKREVTKEDCCIARVLVLYLSFKHILLPNPNATETHANYIGEISLNDGDLNLEKKTEQKLFTLIRTGLLGAALLGDKNRHVFHYRKDGIKQGRKYCASQVTCKNIIQEDEIVSQNMDICLFTVEEKQNAAIPRFIFDSIENREELIQKALNKMTQGDELDDSK